MLARKVASEAESSIDYFFCDVGGCTYMVYANLGVYIRLLVEDEAVYFLRKILKEHCFLSYPTGRILA